MYFMFCVTAVHGMKTYNILYSNSTIVSSHFIKQKQFFGLVFCDRTEEKKINNNNDDNPPSTKYARVRSSAHGIIICMKWNAAKKKEYSFFSF